MKNHALMPVKKCLNSEVCVNFDNFFKIGTYEKTTRRMISCCKVLRYVFSLLNLVFVQ